MASQSNHLGHVRVPAVSRIAASEQWAAITDLAPRGLLPHLTIGGAGHMPPPPQLVAAPAGGTLATRASAVSATMNGNGSTNLTGRCNNNNSNNSGAHRGHAPLSGSKRGHHHHQTQQTQQTQPVQYGEAYPQEHLSGLRWVPFVYLVCHRNLTFSRYDFYIEVPDPSKPPPERPTFVMGDYVLCEADRGVHIGQVVSIEPFNSAERHYAAELMLTALANQSERPRVGLPHCMILRHASAEEIAHYTLYMRAEAEACMQIATAAISGIRQLVDSGMQIIDAEIQLDRHKITLYYFSNVFVTVKPLVAALYKTYGCRILVWDVTKTMANAVQSRNSAAEVARATSRAFGSKPLSIVGVVAQSLAEASGCGRPRAGKTRTAAAPVPEAATTRLSRPAALRCDMSDEARPTVAEQVEPKTTTTTTVTTNATVGGIAAAPLRAELGEAKQDLLTTVAVAAEEKTPTQAGPKAEPPLCDRWFSPLSTGSDADDALFCSTPLSTSAWHPAGGRREYSELGVLMAAQP